MSAQIYLAIAIATGALTIGAFVVFFAPEQIQDEVLRGYRATRRKDALESSALLRAVWPMVRLFTHYGAMMPLKSWKERNTLLLRKAGEPLGLSVNELLGVMFTSVICSFAVSLLFAQLTDIGFGLVIVGLALGLGLPSVWLNDRAAQRLQSINRGLPQALDLIVLSMGAGLDFINAVRHVVEKWSDKKDPLYEELSRFLYELNLGKTRKEALEDLEYRAPTDMVKTFVTNAVQAEKRGTPLVEILKIQADVARSKRFQSAEKMAGRAAVMILMPLMLIFSATVLVMFGSLIVKGFRGQLF